MAVSIVQIAKQAGVSAATVSKVLNNAEGARVGAATRERVIKVAKDANYQPNRMARSMVRKQTNTVGLMVSGLENPFFVAVMEALERPLVQSGYQVMLDSAPSDLGTYMTHGNIRGWPVDGVLMWAFTDQTATEFLGPIAEALPTVYLGYKRTDRTDWVAFDHYLAGHLAAEHLLEIGHRRLIIVTPHVTNNVLLADERYFGIKDACKDSGASCDHYLVAGLQSIRSAAFETGQRLAAERRADEAPMALVCHNDQIALGVMHGLRREGMRIPEDFAVVGFDGIDEGRYQDIRLTTVVSPLQEFGDSAVRILMERLSNPTGEKSHTTVKPQLSVGSSTYKGR
jgi:DNA-binding LacI/PurR family transcriptional regulator